MGQVTSVVRSTTVVTQRVAERVVDWLIVDPTMGPMDLQTKLRSTKWKFLMIGFSGAKRRLLIQYLKVG
jgi:hypothetical protein